MESTDLLSVIFLTGMLPGIDIRSVQPSR